jgi:tetratricopeptide (TPR) repeat protein
MMRILVVLGIAVTLSISGGLGLIRGHDAATSTAAPSDASAAAGFHGADLEQAIAGLQTHLRSVPGDAPGWATLALAYVEQARITGDPTLYPQSGRAARRSLTVQPRDNTAAYAALAALAAARHHFSAALGAARHALSIDPYQPGALAVRVDALTELGRYPAQLRALRVADRRQPGEPVTTRYSYAYELRGRLDRAAALLRHVTASSSPADRAYALTLLADIERRQGRLDDAAAHLRQALVSSPGYVAALASRARLSVARGHLPQAVRRWRQVVARLPLPEYLTELGELQVVLGHHAQAARSFAVVATTNRLLASNGVNTDLEAALFEADHGSPATALREARAEWGRRHSIHVADVLAWALHRTGHDHRALHFTRLATRLGTPEARLWVHRGEIEAALGLRSAARQDLRRGLANDPGLSPWQARGATTVLRDLRSRA